MNAKEILTEMSKLKSGYGYGARIYLNDPVKGPAFLKEIHEQIVAHPKSARQHFGDKMVDEIIKFCECYKS